MSKKIIKLSDAEVRTLVERVYRVSTKKKQVNESPFIGKPTYSDVADMEEDENEAMMRDYWAENCSMLCDEIGTDDPSEIADRMSAELDVPYEVAYSFVKNQLRDEGSPCLQ